MDFLEPLKTSELLEQAKAILREKVPFYDKDRYFSPDIVEAINLIENNVLSDVLSIRITR